VAEPALIRAAGGVLWRRDRSGSVEVALVHRPRYDDWSLPKGKLDRGEHVLAAAVREVREETGVWPRLCRPLPNQRYTYVDRDGVERRKEVRYWVAVPVDGVAGPVPDTFTPTAEIDQVVWLPPAAAMGRLTHPRDRDLLRALGPEPSDAGPLILLRHAAAVKRKVWAGDDEDRPLSPAGQADAAARCPLLAAYRPPVAVSSPARRCVDTVRPYTEAFGLPILTDELYSEKAYVTRPEEAVRRARELLGRGEGAVICTHRPALPGLLAGLGVQPPPERLKPGEFVALHPDRDGRVVAEQHRP
jgi:8-oxo-(d)GTP phosphatase